MTPAFTLRNTPGLAVVNCPGPVPAFMKAMPRVHIDERTGTQDAQEAQERMVPVLLVPLVLLVFRSHFPCSRSSSASRGRNRVGLPDACGLHDGHCREMPEMRDGSRTRGPFRRPRLSTRVSHHTGGCEARPENEATFSNFSSG